MTTRTTDNGITVLSPVEGMRLTDGETVADGEVYLGANASHDAWREVTEAEAEDIRSEIERMSGADAEALARRRGTLIQSEVERLREEKADIEEKIADPAYIVLRPWLRLKLAAAEAAIRKLDEDEVA